MHLCACRARAWRSSAATIALALALFARAACADEPKPLPLSMDDAAQLAVTAQPLLDKLDAQARAARETAVAARQLPDPRLVTGIQDVPVTTDDAFSVRHDSDTQLQVGLTQEFPRADKRRLRGELVEREAGRLDAEHDLAQRIIRRDTSLAWLELWRAERTAQLMQASLGEARIQLQMFEIALGTGSATQAEFLGARVDVDRVQDSLSGAEQGVAHSQNTLSRWIGDDAFRATASELPAAPPLPPLQAVLERVDDHPLLATMRSQVDAAQTGALLAKAEYKPDWRVELGYANRPEYSEMLTLRVGVDLPLFTHNRQDRSLAAALAQRDAAEFAVEDARRQLIAEARLNHHDAERMAARLKDYDSALLPQSANRIEAALAGWRAGRDRLRDVLDARRAAVDVRMARLELQHDLAKHFVELSYVGAFGPAEVGGENSHE